jgi:glycosyltransferase involved in cell wall biosynthesis
MGLADRIQFFVDIPHEEMPSYFCRASVFSFPSRQEGFGLVLLEAGAFSLPVVASRVGGIPELIEDSVTGILIEPDDPTALAHALRKLFSEPGAAQQLGDRLHRRVCDDFSWINTLQQYEALIEEDSRRTVLLPGPQNFLPNSDWEEAEHSSLSV